MKYYRLLLIISILFVVPFCTIMFFSVVANKTQMSIILLKSSRMVVNNASAFVTSNVTPNTGEDVFWVNSRSGEINKFDRTNKLSPHQMAMTYGVAAVSPNGAIATVSENSTISLFDRENNLKVKFKTFPVTSLSFSNNGEQVIVASPNNENFLHIFNSKGQLDKSFGVMRKYDKSNDAQNRFLHKGKVLVNAQGEIYFVYFYLPLIQKYSVSGKLLQEINVEGDAVNIQMEVSQRFTNNKKAEQIGGITIINSAAIDNETGNLWIGMNGSSNSGTIYEYSDKGEKINEYILQTESNLIPSQYILSVKDLKLTRGSLYVLTEQAQVFEFEKSAGLRIGYSNVKSGGIFKNLSSITSFNTVSSNFVSLPTMQTCPTSQNWSACTFNCPDKACNGTEPTATSSNKASLDCKTALETALATGYTLVASNCNQFPAGSSEHMRGGCKSTATICRGAGTQSSHEAVLDCAAPDCSNDIVFVGCGDSSCIYSYQYVCNDGYCTTCVQVGGCSDVSPIVIDIKGNGYDMTSELGGVWFDLGGLGQYQHMSWTKEDSDDAFLCLDRNGNEKIDNGTELFGNATPQPTGVKGNGFLALAEYDKPANGGNNDGKIDDKDQIFASLRLWQDQNHNGISEANELSLLSELGVAILDLDYKESKRTDEHGNRFKYRAKVKDVHGAQVGRWAWDIFPVVRKGFILNR